MALLLLNARHLHQLGQIFVAGHEKGLILRQELILPAGYDRRNSARNGNDPEWKIPMLAGNFFQASVCQRRCVMNAGGHDLNLSLGHIDDIVACAKFDQPHDLLSGQFFGVNDQVDF